MLLTSAKNQNEKTSKLDRAQYIFNFNSSPVRTFLDDNNELWFCAPDVCSILGYLNTKQTIENHCKNNGVSKRYTIDSMGRKQEVTVINEPNLYRLIIKSRKPEAEAFEAWVMEKVLPLIRKTGGYSVQVEAAPAVEIELGENDFKRIGNENRPHISTLMEVLRVIVEGSLVNENMTFDGTVTAICERTKLDIKTCHAAINYLRDHHYIRDTGERTGRTKRIVVYKPTGFDLANASVLAAPSKPVQPIQPVKKEDSITAVFHNMLTQSGFVVNEVIADGEFHRVKLETDYGNECSGTYILNLEGGIPMGGLWRGRTTSQWYLWELRSQRLMTFQEKQLRKKIIGRMNAYCVK